MKRIAAIFFLYLIAFPLRMDASKTGFRTIGDVGQFAVPAAAAVYSFSEGDRVGVGELIHATFYTMAIVEGLKFTINSHRPECGRKSFPSGHTASAFAGASYIHHRYGLKNAVPAYLAATVVGVSRVYCRKHYTHDVLAAAAIAYTVSRLCTTRYGFSISPLVQKDCAGLCLNAAL